MFREAASLILTTAASHARYPCNFGIVMLKRSSKLKFMPNTYIFPGGAVSKADGDLAWKDHYSRKDIAEFKPRKSSLPRPPMYINKEGELDRDLSLRLTSVRECFEESGILYLEKNGELITETSLPVKELGKWRTDVENDAKLFYELCKELDAWPAVNRLFDWSNWLTPPSILPYRFDTAFYIANIPKIPSYAKQDGGETVDMAILNPFEALAKQDKSEIILHPPQFVELGRLAKFYNMDAAMSYSKSRQDHGLVRWCPVQYYFEGCRISAMEGDDLHKDYIEGSVIKDFEGQSEEEQSKMCENLSRTIWTYEIDEKTGKKKYSTMFTKTNQFYFDNQTLMTTPIDHETLKFMIGKD